MAKEMTKSQKQHYYKQIANRSFKTVFDQYLFSRYSQGLGNSINCDDFKTFEFKLEIIKEYVNEYWQKDYDFHKEGWVYSIKEIETHIYNWGKDRENKVIVDECKDYYRRNRFEIFYPYQKFLDLLEVKTCYYCGISVEGIIEMIGNNKINKKKVTRGWTLEIDRKKPNLEYTPDNCVRCCYWCNSAKTDEFDDIEFIPIGEAIKQIWHERLSS